MRNSYLLSRRAALYVFWDAGHQTEEELKRAAALLDGVKEGADYYPIEAVHKLAKQTPLMGAAQIGENENA